MPNVPKKVYERLAAGIIQFQPILASAKSRDVNAIQLKGSDPFNSHSIKRLDLKTETTKHIAIKSL